MPRPSGGEESGAPRSWHVTFTIDTDPPAPLEETSHAVGVDLGVKDFAVTSRGERIPNLRHLERKARNLARYQ